MVCGLRGREGAAPEMANVAMAGFFPSAETAADEEDYCDEEQQADNADTDEQPNLW